MSDESGMTVFGLGEAGSRIAADLASNGVEVHGFDPADVPVPPGVRRHEDPRQAVAGSSIVLAVTAGSDSLVAITQALDAIQSGALYADLATSSAGRKKELARVAATRGLEFADVALMSTVPGKGLGTPTLASGAGAVRFAETLNPLGARCDVVDGPAGEAATRKLLRSVVMKGLASVLIEALRAGEAADRAGWLWQNVVDELSEADGDFLARLVVGTGPHAVRRGHEMKAASELLVELGVEPVMTGATVLNLSRVEHAGVPEIPDLDDDAGLSR